MHCYQGLSSLFCREMADINELRTKMDEITIEMIKLLKTRTDIAKEIGEVKKNIGKGVTDETRENNLRSKIIKLLAYKLIEIQ